MDWAISYQHDPKSQIVTAIICPLPSRPARLAPLARFLGFALLALGLGGLTGPLIPALRLESSYLFNKSYNLLRTISFEGHRLSKQDTKNDMPKNTPIVFTPLVTPDGSSIDPVNREFALVVPSVGINAPIIPNVDPVNPGEYLEALKTGIAHASTSFLPDEDGTVYLFSHSTNYDWFVKDLNAVFYLLKNLREGDLIVIFYKGKQYTYKLRETKVVKPSEISYLVPQAGKKSLILQTCWPPGSISERLLLFADLIE